MTFKKFDLVFTTKNNIGFIVSEKMDIPYLHDGCGSANYNTPSGVTPEDFDSFEGYLVHTIPEGSYEVCAHHSLRAIDLNCPYDQTSVFDHATSGMRFHLTLLKLLEDTKKREL